MQMQGALCVYTCTVVKKLNTIILKLSPVHHYGERYGQWLKFIPFHISISEINFICMHCYSLTAIIAIIISAIVMFCRCGQMTIDAAPPRPPRF